MVHSELFLYRCRTDASMLSIKEGLKQSNLGPSLVRLQLAWRSFVDRLPIAPLVSFLPNIKLRKTPDVVFIWIPKNSGSSVFVELKHKLGLQKIHRPNRFKRFPSCGSVTPSHVSWRHLIEAGYVSQSYSDRAYKFAIVRNPYSRIVSLYNYSRRYGFSKAQTLPEFLDDIESRRYPLGLYNQKGLSQANQQVDWILNEDGTLLVDDLFRFEDLEALTSTLSQRFGVNFDFSRKFNASADKYSVEDLLLDKESLVRINSLYEDDFTNFGYEIRK